MCIRGVPRDAILSSGVIFNGEVNRGCGEWGMKFLWGRLPLKIVSFANSPGDWLGLESASMFQKFLLAQGTLGDVKVEKRISF